MTEQEYKKKCRKILKELVSQHKKFASSYHTLTPEQTNNFYDSEKKLFKLFTDLYSQGFGEMITKKELVLLIRFQQRTRLMPEHRFYMLLTQHMD